MAAWDAASNCRASGAELPPQAASMSRALRATTADNHPPRPNPVCLALLSYDTLLAVFICFNTCVF
ncbi:hypothetical protein KTAU_35070 [Thermogemmatispora aurantia]|uniref:Uncharacterized protein n=1 Tax=Thermogemmatispora aurantia TaxID=2045279 RepID=A0A5J4KEQ2_9CHLR|nr:hypothetical protein KTAU_35070 [Thermogemmatispora aurantia]